MIKPSYTCTVYSACCCIKTVEVTYCTCKFILCKYTGQFFPILGHDYNVAWFGHLYCVELLTCSLPSFHIIMSLALRFCLFCTEKKTTFTKKKRVLSSVFLCADYEQHMYNMLQWCILHNVHWYNQFSWKLLLVHDYYSSCVYCVLCVVSIITTAIQHVQLLIQWL